MEKIENWDNIEVNEFTENEKFILGGKLSKIVNVRNYDYNGEKRISLEVDIAEGNNTGYFQKKYDERNENAKFWDDGAQITFPANPTEDRDKAYIKGLIKAIESYNPGFVWNWDEMSLKDKYLGTNFSLKEYQGSDGNIYTKPQVSRYVNSKENFREDYIPNVKTLNNGFVNYEEYISNKDQNSNNNDSVEIVLDDESLPF